MIQREWQSVTRRVFKDGTNDYGQLRKLGYDDYTIKMVVKIYTQTSTENPRFLDVDLLGLTKDTVECGDQIIIGTKKYDVKYTIPSEKLTQVFMTNG